MVNVIVAQDNCSLSASMEAEIPNITAMPVNFCFDVDWVQENCIPIYINVNVHFFLDDDCQGNLATAGYVQENLSPQNAFNLAETMINDANDFFEVVSENNQGQWNSEFHSTTETTPQCIPVRYVLNGTYVHCDSGAQNTSVNFSDFSDYEIDGSTTMNIYIANVNGGTTGFASNNSNDAVVENFNPGTLNHELGHGFGLGHSFNTEDGCDDTWDSNWSWDSDCDGTADVFNDKCWNNQPQHDGDNACDLSIFCEKHPCCNWSEQNNNLMTYSQWGFNSMYSALTPCQITRMLTDISDNMCDYVEDINCGCPPPKANIGTLPTIDESTDCPTCFYLNGSFNESVYEMEVSDQLGSSLIETGEVFNQAGRYCITPRIDKYGKSYWPNGLQAGETYTIRLKVYNECGDSDESELVFTLPQPCNILPDVPDGPGPIKFEIVSLSPNPTPDNIAIKYNIKQSGELNIYGVHQSSNSSHGILHSSFNEQQNNKITTINVSNWQSGTNSIIFQFEDEIYIENFIKL